MARTRAQETEPANITVTGHQPVERMPENGMTEAAMLMPVYEKGISKGAEEAQVAEKQPIKRYRILADKIISHGGYRAQLRAGKEFDHRHYSPQNLKQQGVQFEEIAPIYE